MLGLLGVPSLLIVGLILRYADNPQWFNGAHEVGKILIIVSVVVIAITVAILMLIGSAVARGGSSRRRRGF